MEQEKENQMKSVLIPQLVGSTNFTEILKILHELATREVEKQLSEATDERKEEIYKELFQPQSE
jgi:hypothetical protein